MVDITCLREKSSLKNLFVTMKYNRDFMKTNPTYFQPDGLVIFVGSQGSGKSLSAVNYVYALMHYYPNAKIVTNIELKDFPIVSFDTFYSNYLLENNIVFSNDLSYLELEKQQKELKNKVFDIYIKENKVFEFTGAEDLKKYKNGLEGVIFLIDEIQLYFNSLESNNISMEVMQQISQQRKQRIHIVSTSQVFGRIAKPLREQFNVVILCEKKFFGYLQCNSLIDRDSMEGEESTGTNITGKVKKKFWYFRSPSMFEKYDTYKVIENPNIKVGKERQDIYEY